MKLSLITAMALAPGSRAHEGGITLDGSGTTNPSKFYWEVMSLFEARAKPAVKMTYRGVGSSTGQFEFMGEEQGFEAYNDFGSGDMPFSSDKYAALKANGVDVLHVPFCLGAMSFFHNVPASTLPASGLNMDACVLADIFKAEITTWDHADIAALNPDFSPPRGEPIVVYHRTYGSSTTKGITQYLHAACPSKWGADLVGSTIDWPASTVAIEGSGEMSASISSTAYSIGYIDSGHGHDDGLSEIELRNKDGTYQSSTEAIAAGGVQAAAEQALALGVLPDDPSADFSAVSLHNMPGKSTWPIVAVSYLYVRADQTAKGDTAGLLKAFVEFVLSDEGQALVKDYNFEGAPADVLEVSTKALDAMVLPAAAKTWTFESSTNKGGGQLDYVLSAKRRSHFEYAIGEIESEMASVAALAALAADVAGLDAKIDAKTCDCDGAPYSHSGDHHEAAHGSASDSGDEDSQDRDIERAMAVAAAALAVALAACVATCVAFCKLNRLANARDRAAGLASAGDICLPEVKPSTRAYADLETNGVRN